MEESNLSTGGHVLFAHYQQGMTDYLAIALLHHSEGVAVTDALDVTPAKHLDLGQLHLAARINISEWQNNKQSKQYISFIKGKNGKKVSDYFRDFIGCQEGVDIRARRAPCSRPSATSWKAKTCPKNRPARKPRPWSATPPARPSWASRSPSTNSPG